MTHVVTEKCLKCKYTDCASVCPVNCFREGEEILVIDPDICIDCGVCVAECPIQAIVPDYEIMDNAADIEKYMFHYNAKYSKLWPEISQSKKPLPEADKWATVQNKQDLL